MNIEWKEGEQVEVQVEERNAELDSDEESNDETNLKQSADVPKKEENAFGDEGPAVEVEEVEDGCEGRGEEAEEGEEEEVEERERQAYAGSEREVEDGGRGEGRQVRASSVSALSVSGEKILAHRYVLHHPQGHLLVIIM